MTSHLIFGGPGAGKTTRLMEILERELEDGVEPERIAFVSFTTKAVNEGTTRAMIKFRLAAEELPWFRTLHSMCFRRLGLQMHQDTLDPDDYRELGRALGVKITGVMIQDSDSLEGIPKGDRLVAIDRLARETFTPLQKVWAREGEGMITWFEQQRFSKTLEAFKEDRGGLCDWSDTLLRFAEEGEPLSVDVAVIDETQDLNPAQWAVIERAFSGAQRIYYAGDDDQAIYGWMGADVDRFLALREEATKTEVLPRSHRLPSKVFLYVDELARRITGRHVKHWGPNEDGGEVIRVPYMDNIDLSEPGTWYLLARNRCFLRDYEEACMQQGVLFTTRRGRNTTYPSVDPDHLKAIRGYEQARRGQTMSGVAARLVARYLRIRGKVFDSKKRYSLPQVLGSEAAAKRAEIWNIAMLGIPAHLRAYYTTIRRKGRRLDQEAEIHIDTIHGVKGGEADHVVLACDFTARTEKAMERKPEDEARVFYVGASRARQRLFLLRPQTGRFYTL